MPMVSAELVAAVTWYHKSCYRSYTRITEAQSDVEMEESVTNGYKHL